MIDLGSALTKSGWSADSIESLADSCLLASGIDDILAAFSTLVGEEEALKSIKLFMQGKKKGRSAPQQEKVLGMFKQGRPFKQTKAGHLLEKDSEPMASAPTNEARKRSVINCLGCGMIYRLVRDNDVSELTLDTKKMLETGACTFCGDQISPHESRSTSNQSGPSLQAAKEAYEFKERLLQYDLHATKRTTVTDDQSDFFLVDSISWLSKDEKVELRQTQLQASKTSESRSNLLTIDLLGRRVFVQGSSDVMEGDQQMQVAPIITSRRLQ